MNDELQYHLLTMPDGAQVLTSSAPGVSISVHHDGLGAPESSQQLPVAAAKFAELMKDAKTNRIGFDTISQEITVTPKAPHDTAQN